MTRIYIKVTGVLLAFILLLAGCGVTAAGTETAVPTTGFKIGDLAPDFNLFNLSGEKVSLSGFIGQPVVITFWATDWVYCVGEYPLLEDLCREESARTDGAVVLTLNIRQSSQALEKFNRDHGYTVPVLMDIGGYTAYAYGVSGIPATFFIDRKGIIRAVRFGAFSNMSGLKTQLAKITGA